MTSMTLPSAAPAPASPGIAARAAAACATCLHCQQRVVPISTRKWLVLYVLSWPLAIVGPLLWFGALALVAVVVLPIGVLIMGGVLAPLHERAFAPPRCPLCRRIVVPD